MLDIFQELEIINRLIEEDTYKLEALSKFYHESIVANFEHQVDYQNIDICLDHMSYGDYSKMISQSLRKIMNDIASESQNYYRTIKALKVIKTSFQNQILSISRIAISDFLMILEKFNYHILMEEKIQAIEVFCIQDNELCLNSSLVTLPSEIINFLFFYMNEKSKNPATYIEESFQNFELQKEQRRN